MHACRNSRRHRGQRQARAEGRRRPYDDAATSQLSHPSTPPTLPAGHSLSVLPPPPSSPTFAAPGRDGGVQRLLVCQQPQPAGQLRGLLHRQLDGPQRVRVPQHAAGMDVTSVNDEPCVDAVNEYEHGRCGWSTGNSNNGNNGVDGQ